MSHPNEPMPGPIPTPPHPAPWPGGPQFCPGPRPTPHPADPRPRPRPKDTALLPVAGMGRGGEVRCATSTGPEHVGWPATAGQARREVAEELLSLMKTDPRLTLLSVLEQAFDAGQEYETRRFVERLDEGAS